MAGYSRPNRLDLAAVVISARQPERPAQCSTSTWAERDVATRTRTVDSSFGDGPARTSRSCGKLPCLRATHWSTHSPHSQTSTTSQFPLLDTLRSQLRLAAKSCQPLTSCWRRAGSTLWIAWGGNRPPQSEPLSITACCLEASPASLTPRREASIRSVTRRRQT